MINKDENRISIFWCGSVLNYQGLLRYKGEAPAATPWIKGFLSGLICNNVVVYGLAPIWDSLFPKGMLFPGNRKYLDNELDQKVIKYINLPLLRNISVSYSLYFSLKKKVKKYGKPTAILNYNTYPYYCLAIKKIVKKYPDILWINVVLDLDDPTKDNWKKFIKDTEGSIGTIFLSWWGYKNAPIKNKLHIDCGWDGKFPRNTNKNSKIFLHAGKLTDYGGMHILFEAIKLIDSPDIVFEFYGKDKPVELIELAKQDSRVKVKGFVDEETLQLACEKAFAFLSPREVNFQGTPMIFPSKIMYYLKFQKPIIGSLLPGISPDYEKILIQPKDNCPLGWANAIKSLLVITDSELQRIRQNSQTILAEKIWSNQSEKVVSFIDSLIENK